MIKNIAFLISLYTLAGLCGGYFYLSGAWALSFALGGLLMLVNLLGLAFVWRLIFAKKSIALAVLVIIFKYLIFGMILWSFASVKSLQPGAFVLGLAALLFAIAAATLHRAFKKNQYEEI